MIPKKSHYHSNMLFGAFVISLIFASILNNIGWSRKMGFGAIMLLWFVAYILILHYLSKNKYVVTFFMPSIIWSIIFLIINGFGIFLRHDDRYFITVFQFVMVIFFFHIFSLMNWNKFRLKLLYWLSIFVIGINAIFFIMDGMPKQFSGIFTNPNSLGTLMFLLSFFIMIQMIEKRRIFVISMLFLTMSLLYYSGTRSAMIGVLSAISIYAIWGIISKSKRNFYSFFIVLMMILLLFTYAYPLLINWDEFTYYNYLVYEYTGKSLMTGREKVWLESFSFIQENIWLGHGAGSIPSDFMDVELSSHNLYIQIALQTGILGLSTFLLFLLSIWRMLWHGRKDNYCRLSASFFIGILIHQSFEVTLTQNNVSFGLFQWLIISIGASFAYQMYKQKRLESR